MIKAFPLAILLAASVPARAQNADSERLKEVERKMEVLAGEMERLKLGEAVSEPELVSVHGFGPSASKVYQKAPKRVSIGGYGEMTYQNKLGRRDEMDFLRAVLYAGFKFNDWILFNSELEFEHAATGNGRGEVSVEQAYLDFRFHDAIGARAGLLLVPVGFINEMHEPTTFHGVRRPNVERNILPSTWRENGAGIFGKLGPVTYRTYVLAGLQGVSRDGVDGFTGPSGVRDGRSDGAESLAEDKAFVARLDYAPAAGVLAGGSFYTGQADQHLIASDIPVTLWDLHAQMEYRGAELRALYAQGRIGNVDALNAAQGFAGTDSVGSELFGGYVEAAFDLLSLCPASKGHYLAPFFRYERYDTQLTVPDGFMKDPANSRREYTLGLTYKPIPQVVVKGDYQWLQNQAATGVDQWNLGVGYIF